MKILSTQSQGFPEVRTIRYARFRDHRGYFAELFRDRDFGRGELEFMKGITFSQANESYSKKGTVRGLHFQWDPYQGKLVRTITGHMIDLVADIRKGSPTFGKVIAVDMPAHPDDDFGEWIWVPAGFAHGNCFLQDTLIQYRCTGEYNPNGEAGISPLARDLDWSMCDPHLRSHFERVAAQTELISDKDRNGFSLQEWADDPRSSQFGYHED